MSINNQMKVCIILTVVSFIVVSCSPLFIPAQATPTADYSDLEIIMERGMCFGTCPAYKLQILGSGKGIYQGEHYVAVKGEQTFQVTNEQIRELLAAFEKTDFYSLNDKYVAARLEQAFYKISISYRGKTKTIIHYGGCAAPVANPTPGEPEIVMNEGGAPQSVCELENKIDTIVNSYQWVGESNKP